MNYYHFFPGNSRTLVYRDPNIYFLWPSKRGYTGAYQFARESLSVVEPNGIILADFTLATPLMYLQIIDKYRSDVSIFTTEKISYILPEESWEKLKDIIDLNLSNGKKVYLADDDSRDFFTINKTHFSCWNLLNKRYKVYLKGIIYEINARDFQLKE